MINIKNEFLAAGIMSGTSMDGLDISYAKYYYKSNKWYFDLLHAETFKYDDSVKLDFISAFKRESIIYDVDVKFSHLIADYVLCFLKKYNLKPDLIASHGHTIFHQPHKKKTKQIGLGNIIFDRVNIPVVSNFRLQDIELGGQGAPLVPIGDQLLFSDYDSCVNFGGIVNISYNVAGKRIAYDICPCNMILNYLSQKNNREFDYKGHLASKGIVNIALLNELNRVDYYNIANPKSLGKEYVENVFLRIIKTYNIDAQDLLSTFTEHIAIQIANVFKKCKVKNAFLSGGGVFNDYLITRIKYYTEVEIVIPSDDIINFKESIVFGFLGVLRVLNKNNCLASSTGAIKDHSSGEIYR